MAGCSWALASRAGADASPPVLPTPTAPSSFGILLIWQGPGILFTPVKTMKEAKGFVPVGECLPLNKCKVLHPASDAAIKAGKAVTVLTYLHGVKEANM